MLRGAAREGQIVILGQGWVWGPSVYDDMIIISF